jgi:hypothetical protein
MREEPRSSLSAAELAELKGLETELRGLRKRWRRLVARLERARRSSLRALVRDRLLCVLQDSLAPALHDLRSIEAEAREQPSNQKVIQAP